MNSNDRVVVNLLQVISENLAQHDQEFVAVQGALHALKENNTGYLGQSKNQLCRARVDVAHNSC